MSKDYAEIVEGDIQPLKRSVLVEDIESSDEKVVNGIIIPNETGAERGIRPRWAKVYSVGEEIDEIKVGEWVLIEHGKWTRGIKLNKQSEETIVRMVDINAILASSDEPYI